MQKRHHWWADWIAEALSSLCDATGLSGPLIFLFLLILLVCLFVYGCLWLRKRLGKERLRAYNESRLVRAVAIAATQIYVILGLGVFAARGDGFLRLLHLRHLCKYQIW